MNLKIESVAHYIPCNRFTSEDIEKKISKSFSKIPFWILEEMTWVKTRYFVSDWEYSSDLAIKASEECFKKSNIRKEDIDLLIFASASQDIIEPATWNIVQKWLWLKCPIFDIKNACNSFLSWLDIADSFIKSWKYKNILICSWETPSKVIKYNVDNKLDFKKYFAWYTFWDAWSAMIVTWTDENKWILSTYFHSDWTDWDLWTIMWWWSRYPHEDLNYFTWEPWKLRDKFRNIWVKEFDENLEKLWWQKKDIKQIFVHQVAMSNFDYLQEVLEIKIDKFSIILPKYWNIASCCIPISFSEYLEYNKLELEDKLIFIGFASGFSFSLIFYEF